MTTPDAPPARVFDVHLPDVDADALEQRLQERAAARAGLSAAGMELDEIVRKFDLKSVRNVEEFLRFFMDRLQELHQVDINDFPIQSHRGLVGRPIRLLKSTLWKLLKFYTYRLFSQQNQINAQLAAALDARDLAATPPLQPVRGQASWTGGGETATPSAEFPRI